MRISLPSRQGFGGAPLGNMFRDIPEEEALTSVRDAWGAGTRYFDTAALYGAGQSELRLGRALAGFRRNDYVLNAKVDRIILDEMETGSRDLRMHGLDAFVAAREFRSHRRTSHDS
ncbi:aryl-alcohol dehydrogenase-like predicted oxidoreductase [Sphingomonas kyeonggiensis]|uniref:Aryl-alcohol dehydrogenase-like predicted oxidoreductase n=1 Tax=Sphingomonas kyeonggiensis TaxID=1268553 RepID=A0A7W7K5H2_9SPHN|nr:aldo/keto reductase [Sphingomonas kyeonggiensis]MBB4840906.1 aryl-alcohol dehydrogenase-like predicted oxidoreductase [Sphingomonas kyeonggiensis]